ncbi:hypothetical protein GOBAR_AA01061 [Gossypium barbadense]|uniref:Uncharacterized protein n=1 Tax=Gossypium barbadense TaxID=3634 RepID=A0A2P5YV96_GOSBA|nr:hypothetical protein GOBAR_AA01061 [Gossypium barbadense]
MNGNKAGVGWLKSDFASKSYQVCSKTQKIELQASTSRDFEDVVAELKNTNRHAYDWLKEKNLRHWLRSHFSIRSQSDMVNNLSECFNKVILEARGKPILTMMETIRTKIMLLIVKKKEEAEKIKGILCLKIKKKLDVNIRDSLRCGAGRQHVVDLVENSYSYRRRPGKPTKVRRKEPDEPETTERLTKRGEKMRYNKCKKLCYNKRSCREEVGQNVPQQATPTQQETALTHQQTASTHQ